MHLGQAMWELHKFKTTVRGSRCDDCMHDGPEKKEQMVSRHGEEKTLKTQQNSTGKGHITTQGVAMQLGQRLTSPPPSRGNIQTAVFHMIVNSSVKQFLLASKF